MRTLEKYLKIFNSINCTFNFLAIILILSVSSAARASTPTIVSATVPTNGSYAAGAHLDFTVTWDQFVDVDSSGGTPDITVTLSDASTVTASYISGSGSDTLTFRYTVAFADADGAVGVDTSINLNGGTITDTTTGMDSADLTMIPFGATGAILIDNSAPTVTSVSVPPDHTYIAVNCCLWFIIFDHMDFVVHFSEIVNVGFGGFLGMPHMEIDIGGVTREVDYASGTGTNALTFRYDPVAGDVDTDGIGVGATIATPSGSYIRDVAGNNIVPTLNSIASTTNVVVDGIIPTVSSIVRADPDPTNATTLHFTVTFSEGVNGVDASDFSVTASGSASASVASVSAVSSSVYTVTIDNVSGAGTLRLDLNPVPTTGITDLPGNPIYSTYTTGQQYTVDTTAPTITSINRLTPATAFTHATSVTYRVTFSEAVSGIDTSDFALTTTGAAGGTIDSVSSPSGSTVDVSVNGVSGDGTLRLDLNSSGTGITDGLANAIDGGFTSGQVYTIDNTAPTVVSVNRQSPLSTPTNTIDVTFRITFSESVGGLIGTDLDLTVPSGTFSSLWIDSITAVSPDGSGNSDRWDIVAHTSGGIGTVNLNVRSSGVAVADAAGNVVTGGFSSGQTFAIDTVAPSVNSITRASSNPTTAGSVNYTVTFSEGVSGVDVSDFALTTTGNANGTVASVTPVSSSVYTVTVNNLVGNGTLRLDLNGSGTGIVDTASNAISGGFTSGDSYTSTQAIDVGVAFTHDMSSANAGGIIVYTFTVTNNGPGDATATSLGSVGVNFAPISLTGLTWTCMTGTGTATCPNASGVGALSETVDLPAGSSLVYVASGTVGVTEAVGTFSVTASITPPNGIHDYVTGNDTDVYVLPVGIYINGFEDN